MMRDVAFFIISCDKNTQVVSLVIESLHAAVGTEVPIYVSTDGPMPRVEQTGATVLVSNDLSFGDRMQAALRQVPYDQVIVMCDDFVIEGPADVSELNQLSDQMKCDASIACIALAQVSGENTSEYLLSHYVKRAAFGTYKTTLQCGLWRRDVLVALMEGVTSPWEFELFANHHTYHDGRAYYALVDDAFMPLRYNRGKLVIRGHVVLPEMERIEYVLERTIDLSDMPVTDSYVQRRGMSVWERVKRRIRLELSDKYYRYWKRR